MGITESKSVLDAFLQRSKTAKNLQCPLMTIVTKQEHYHFMDVRKQALADPGDGDIYLEFFWAGTLPQTLKTEFQLFKTVKDTLDDYGGEPVGPFRVAECPGKSLIGLPVKIPRDSLASLGEDMFTGEGHTDAHTAEAMSGFNLAPYVNPSLGGSSRIELLFANSLNLTPRTDTALARLLVGEDRFEFTDIRQNHEHTRAAGDDTLHYVLYWKAPDDVDIDSYSSPKFVSALAAAAPYLSIEGPTRSAGCVLPLIGVPVSLTPETAIELGSQIYLGFARLVANADLPVRPPEALKTWTDDETRSWFAFINQPQLFEVFRREEMQPIDLLTLEGQDFDSFGLAPADLAEFKQHLEALKGLQV